MNQLKTILKLKKIFSMGYVPSRGSQSYAFVCQRDNATYAQHVNCFAHACFNLTNEQLEAEGFDYNDRISFSSHICNTLDNYIVEEKNIIRFIESSGLKMRPINCYELIAEHPEFLQRNQWIVAVYFTHKKGKKDIHFFLREQDGTWSGKCGFRNEITHFDELPSPYYSNNEDNDVYYFHNQYLITNPYARALEKEELVCEGA